MKETIFVLIMVFGGASTQSGLSTITAEFSSFANCEAARKKIEKDWDRRRVGNPDQRVLLQVPMVTQGCYAK